MIEPTPALELENVTVCRGRPPRPILDDITWRVERGCACAVLGPNGAGKSTLLSVITGYLWPNEGAVRLLGATAGQAELAIVRERVGTVGASRMPAPRDEMTALEAVTAGVRGRIILPLSKPPTPAEHARALHELEAVGMAGRAGDRIEDFSSGERMRVALARALAAPLELLILDEPTASLDMAARAAFLDALERLRDRRPGLTILIVTHHVEELPANLDRALLLREGRVAAEGLAADVLTSERLSEAYGCPVEVLRDAGRWWTRVRPRRAWDV